jgi:hypothetical protein
LLSVTVTWKESQAFGLVWSIQVIRVEEGGHVTTLHQCPADGKRPFSPDQELLGGQGIWVEATDLHRNLTSTPRSCGHSRRSHQSQS